MLHGNENEEKTELNIFRGTWNSMDHGDWLLSKLFYHERIGKCVEVHKHKRENIRVRTIPVSTDHGSTESTSRIYPVREMTYWLSRKPLIVVCQTKTFGTHISAACVVITRLLKHIPGLNWRIGIGLHGFIWSSDLPEQAKHVGADEMHQMLTGKLELETILFGGMDTLDRVTSSLMTFTDGSDLTPCYDYATGALTWLSLKEELSSSSQEESLSQAISPGENGGMWELTYRLSSEESENSE